LQQFPSLKAIHVAIAGYTAFFKHPLTITGTQVSLPCPPYSTLLGLISTCAGKVISYKDTRIGYEYRCTSSDVELERTDRMIIDNKEILRPHPEGQSLIKRYIHFRPQLDLYLTNIDLLDSFKKPSSCPYLGRSQDMIWITHVEIVELKPAASGLIGPTMMPYSQDNIPSLIIRCPEWFSNETKGRTRIAGPIGFYQTILPSLEMRIEVKMQNLYHPSNMKDTNDVIYLHQWTPT